MISIKIYEGKESIESLRNAWEAILPNERWSFFLKPNWINAIQESYFQNSKIKIIVAFLNNEVVGILPFSNFRMNQYGLYLKVTEIIPGRGADYVCPIIKTGHENMVLPEMLKTLLQQTQFTGTLIFYFIPEVSIFHSILKSFLECRRLPYVEMKSNCAWLPIEENNASMEKKWSRKHQSDLRRRERKLTQEHGPVELYVISSSLEAKNHLPLFFEMHNKKWLSQNIPAVFSHLKSQQFIYKLVDYLWSEGIHFSALKCGDRIISYHFGFFANGYLLYYRNAYDINYHQYSPSKLHINCLIKEGIRKGWKGFDFLQGEESYKYCWTRDRIETSTFLVKTKKFSIAYYWLTIGRPFAEKTIGKMYLRFLAFWHNLKTRRQE